MRIALVTPAGPGTRNGNRHTALRWAAFLRAAGHRVSISTQEIGSDADLMLALHARRSHASISAFPREKPLVRRARPAPTCTATSASPAEARESLELAHRLIVLQPKAAEELRAPLRKKVRVVVQSSATTLRHRPVSGKFRICVIGHLRDEKDPSEIVAALPFVARGRRGRPSRCRARSETEDRRRMTRAIAGWAACRTAGRCAGWRRATPW